MHTLSRRLRVLLLLGLLGPSSAAGVQASPAPAPPPLPLISRGVPAFASGGYPASNANDANYATSWRSETTPSTSAPAWVAYDLSGVPAAQRHQVLAAWYSIGDWWTVAVYYAVPRDYTLEANAAPGGSVPPPTGWTALATVSGNVYTRRDHLLDLTGYNWLRLRVTASNGSSGNTDVGFQLDVHDAAQGTADAWLMLGDSITAEGMDVANITGDPWTGGNLAQLVAAARGSQPVILDGGTGGMNMAWANQNKVNLLAPFTGRYVGISYGTNDANTSGALSQTTIQAYYQNLLGVVDYVLSLGMVPVVPHIPSGTNNGGWLGTNAKTLNDYVDAHLWADRPTVVRGPDLWTFFQQHPELLHDGIHPTYTAAAGQLNGYEQYQRLWRDAMLANVYSGTPSSCIVGDINCDGVVDIRDYGLWRQNFGQTNCGNPADLNGDCIVDIRDYGIWRQNFGQAASAAPAGAAPVLRPTGR